MAEARLNKEYAARIAGIGALMLGICAWSIYDGKVAWPKENEKMSKAGTILLATNLTAEAWLATQQNGSSRIQDAFSRQGDRVPKKLIKKLNELRLPDTVTERREEMRSLLQRRVSELMKQPIYSDHDLGTQTVQAIVTGLFGCLAFFSLLCKAPKHFFADETGLTGTGFGTPLSYADILAIDWSRWEKKGIAVLKTKSRVITLDAWHFSGIPGIVEEITTHRPDLKDGKKK